MSNYEYNVRREAARLGGLSSYGRIPEPDQELYARRQLATARIDRELRNMSAAGLRLDDVRAAHLVGLLLSTCGVKHDAIVVIESTVRAAIVATDGGVI